MEKSDHSRKSNLLTIKRVLIGILIILLLNAAYVAESVVVPIVLGFLIALTLRPIVRGAARKGIPAWLVALLVMPVLGATLAVIAYTLSGPMTDLVSSAPRIGHELEYKFAEYRNELKAVQDASKQVENIAKGGEDDTAQKVVVEQPALLSAAVSGIISGLASLAVALVLATFLLSTGTLFYEKLIGLMPDMTAKKNVLRLVYDVEKQVSRYLLTITIINIGLGVAIGSGLALYGMEKAFLWGAMAAAFNFLPFVGALVGIACVAAVAIVDYPTLGSALVAPGIYALCTTVEGNFITPMIVGRRLELNIVAVFLAVVVWGWMWGIAGALMAVPILVVIKAICDHSDALEMVGEFLSARHLPSQDEPEESTEKASAH